MLIEVIFGVFYIVIHYLTSVIDSFIHKHRYKLMSFAGGISIAYILLSLLPELYQGVEHLNNLLFLFILLGFTIIHLVEKYLYKHEKKKQLRKNLNEVHKISILIYQIILGTLLVGFLSKSLIDGILFFIPTGFHTLIGSTSLLELHSEINKIERLLLYSSTLIGVLIALFFNLGIVITHILLAIISGALLYMVIRESLPRGSKGAPTYFVEGTLIYTIVIIVTWTI